MDKKSNKLKNVNHETLKSKPLLLLILKPLKLVCLIGGETTHHANIMYSSVQFHFVNGQKLQVVDKFTYLGSTLSRAVHIGDEVTARTAKASVAFGRIRTNVWERNGIRLDTKLKVFKAVVLPTLLYAIETWTVYQRHAKKLNHFHLSCLRKILKIRWQDKIPDTEVMKKAKMQSVHILLKLAQLRWTGHVTRMPDERLPKKVLYGELQEGKRSQGVQKKRYKDTLKTSLKDFNIPTESWEQAAQDRTKW